LAPRNIKESRNECLFPIGLVVVRLALAGVDGSNSSSCSVMLSLANEDNSGESEPKPTSLLVIWADDNKVKSKRASPVVVAHINEINSDRSKRDSLAVVVEMTGESESNKAEGNDELHGGEDLDGGDDAAGDNSGGGGAALGPTSSLSRAHWTVVTFKVMSSRMMLLLPRPPTATVAVAMVKALRWRGSTRHTNGQRGSGGRR
jgi:hypothetical protein